MSDDVFTDMLEDEMEHPPEGSWELFLPKKPKEWRAICDEEDIEEAANADWSVVDETGEMVARIHGITVGDAISNADLVASAPSMRRALHRILHCDDIDSAIRIAKHAGAETSNSDIPGGSWKEQCLAARELKNLFLAEAANLRSEIKRLTEVISMVRHNAIVIQNIRWGSDGDCGAIRFAECIESDCDMAINSMLTSADRHSMETAPAQNLTPSPN